jgi:hypothetical protein
MVSEYQSIMARRIWQGRAVLVMVARKQRKGIQERVRAR